MRGHRWNATIGLAAAAMALLFAAPARAADPVIWFCPLDTVPRPDHRGPAQYMDLFRPDAPWSVAARRVSVFAIYTEWVGRATDDDLHRQFADLRRRGIALAWEPGPLTTAKGDEPGMRGEGSGGERILAHAQRILANGGDLKFIDMDEPLYFSALSTRKKRTPPMWSVEQVAADAAKNLLPLKAMFPGLRIGDTEPIGTPGVPVAKALDRYRRGIEAFEKAFGSPLAFFQLDISSRSADLAGELKQEKAMLDEEHVPIGVIYNGSALSPSNDEWLSRARQRQEDVEAAIGVPDIVIFQSWNEYPQVLLPESDPHAFTHLILDYHAQP